jgi:predicted dinucleotide-binding enzyme
MYRPDFPGGPPTMFICGNDVAAKKSVRDILIAFGWDIVDIGDIQGSRLLEPLAIL